MQTILFDHITIGMAFMFIVTILLMFFLQRKRTKQANVDKGYHIDNYYTFKWENLVIHFLGGFICLMLVHELGELLLPSIFNKLGIDYAENAEHGFLYTMSVLCAGRGGGILASLLEKWRRKANIEDTNIEHKHGQDCGHNL